MTRPRARLSDMTHLFPLCCLIVSLFLGIGDRSLANPIRETAPSDPFAYCSRIGSIDLPAGGAAPVPKALEPFLESTLGVPNGALTRESYYWRCMDGAVYVCAIGANIPCDAKANRATRSLGAENYCRANRDAPIVPAYATGHASIYEWSCRAGSALRGKRLVTIDRRGYRTDIWYRVGPGVPNDAAKVTP
jgi:hypothetical protein